MHQKWILGLGLAGVAALLCAVPPKPPEPTTSAIAPAEPESIPVHLGHMLRAQTAVHDATKSGNRNSQAQAARETKIIAEADRLLNRLAGQGSAIAFSQVLQDVRRDMVAVQRRLATGDFGPETLALEEEIIGLLKEMIDSLTKRHGETGSAHRS